MCKKQKMDRISPYILTAVLMAAVMILPGNLSAQDISLDSAKPKVWWFHGAVEETGKGITDDLKAFRDAGIGGVVYYDQVHKVYGNPSAVFSPDWWEKLKLAAREAKRMGLTFELNISNGYVAGGPWIDAEHAMQHIVATDTIVESDSNQYIIFPSEPENYHDIAVVAYPIGNISIWKMAVGGNPLKAPTYSGIIDTGSDSTIIRSLTIYGKGRTKSPTSAMNIPCKPGQQSIAAANFNPLPPMGELQCSDDGRSFRKVCDIPPLYNDMGWKLGQLTVSIPNTKARYFRLFLHDWNITLDNKAPLTVTAFTLSNEPVIDRWEEKTANRSNFIEYTTQQENQWHFPSNNDIKILKTSALPGKSLGCTVPQGHWRVMRFGYQPTGAKIKHGRRGMTGLECDRLSKEAAKLQYDNYFKRIADTLKVQGTPILGAVSDSHEAGTQNWTRGFEHEFERINGYSLLPWLPALRGYIVGSRQQTEDFLLNYRQTLSKMVAKNFFGTIDSLCRRDGYEFTAQAMGNGMCFPVDNIAVKSHVMKPQGEFWTYQTDGSYDIKEAASAAHVYGKRVASAESFTDCSYQTSFEQLKSLADFALCMGVNEFVVCASPYQPGKLETPLDINDAHPYALNRNNPKWKDGKWFWNYLGESSRIMRTGHPVSDICVCLGDEVPMKLLSHRLPELPTGYGWDVCTGDAFEADSSAFSDHPSELTARYRLIAVEDSALLKPATLRRLKELATRGFLVTAKRNGIEAAARNYGFLTDEYSETLDSLFSMPTVSNKSISEALQSNGIQPDIRGIEPDCNIFFAHRATNNSDTYIIYNMSNAAFSRQVTFRAKGNASLLNLKTGRKEHHPSGNFRLDLAPQETVIVSFRH